MLKALLDADEPDKLVIAFTDDLDNSKGTRHMVQAAKKAGVRVGVVALS